MHASGTFEIKMLPQPPEGHALLATIGRNLLEKTYQGELSGTSRGQMLAIRSAVAGSAGYVAIEFVSGTLGGRSGSFALQHSGSMNRSAAQLSVTVVPDSGTDDLIGLSGSLAIRIEQGKHIYDLEYSIDADKA